MRLLITYGPPHDTVLTNDVPITVTTMVEGRLCHANLVWEHHEGHK